MEKPLARLQPQRGRRAESFHPPSFLNLDEVVLQRHGWTFVMIHLVRGDDKLQAFTG